MFRILMKERPGEKPPVEPGEPYYPYPPYQNPSDGAAPITVSPDITVSPIVEIPEREVPPPEILDLIDIPIHLLPFYLPCYITYQIIKTMQ